MEEEWGNEGGREKGWEGLALIFIVHLAPVQLIPLERDVSRMDIECPGDMITYRCSVMSNSETVQLTWRVTLPGQMPVSTTYDNTSNLNTVDNLGMNITTTLEEFRSDEYIESTIVLTILEDVFLINGTEVECVTEDLAYDRTTVLINTSGIL